MIADDFSKRLEQACDVNPHIPPKGQGRQTWVKERMDVSHEAVRKWFAGESRPRPKKMTELAHLIDADEVWLSLGVTPELDKKSRKARNAVAEGAVNAVVGAVQLNGGHVAFPVETDPKAEYVDFYAIVKGRQVSAHVSLATPSGDDEFVFRVPVEFPELTVMGVVHVFPLRLHILKLTTSLLAEHLTRRGGFCELKVRKVGSEYYVGDDKVPRLHSLADLG